jgi:hypothetical protein
MYYLWIPQGFIFKLGKHSNDAIEYEVKLRKQILHQELCRSLIKGGIPMCYPWQWIMWKLHFQGYKCATKWFLGLDNCLVFSPIAHGHGDKKYAQYLNELWPKNPNLIGSLLQLFCTLEVTSISYTKLLCKVEPT